MTSLFETGFGPALSLARYPERKHEELQAFDAADSLLLEELASDRPTLVDKRILVVRDAFGALSVPLATYGATTYTDSFSSARAIARNADRNPSETKSAPRVVHRLADLEGPYDLVLLRPPKNLAFLEDLLATLSTKLAPGARLVAGVMVKHQSDGAFELLERLVGPTRTSLAKKKARLIFADFVRAPSVSPFPRDVRLDGFDRPFHHPSNLFSRERLDIGTRFFLEHLPARDARSILDLGCANGIVGIAAGRMHPSARVTYTDDSWMAVESAKENHARFGEGREADFAWTNAYEDGPDEAHDLVLCNPPFHQGTTVGDQIAGAMFHQAHRVLRPGGRLRVIGNAHLGYPARLARIFGGIEPVARNAKFTVVDAIKR